MNAFNHLPKLARTWIYASGRLLHSNEIEMISQKTAAFIQGWTAHEIPVDASFTILHDCFLIIAVNEDTSDISGCGIDKSFAFIKALGAEMNIDFLNRMQIEVLTPEGIQIMNKRQALDGIVNGSISATTTTFDKSLTRLEELETRFAIPVHKSWYFPQQTAAFVADK